VVLAAITREGEEAELMREWGRTTGRNPFLIVVPRHPQRFDEVEALLVQHGLRVARRSSWGDMPSSEALQVDAWLGDSLGEMPQYYASSDVALLGGSFMALGGHNLIEAAACGCPIVMGPSTFNFAEAARQAALAGAAGRSPTCARAAPRAAGGGQRAADDRQLARARVRGHAQGRGRPHGRSHRAPVVVQRRDAAEGVLMPARSCSPTRGEAARHVQPGREGRGPRLRVGHRARRSGYRRLQGTTCRSRRASCLSNIRPSSRRPAARWTRSSA